MNSKAGYIRHRQIAFIVIALVISIAILFAVIYQATHLKRDIAFSRIISRADVLFEELKFEQAAQMYRSAVAVANTPRDFLGVALRGRDIEKSQGSSGLYQYAVEHAFKRFPGNDKIRALWVDLNIRNGNYLSASQISNSLNNPAFDSIRVEAILLSGMPVEDEGLHGLLRGMDLPMTPEAMADPIAMIQAYELSTDVRYLVNAAVMLAAVGRIEDAYNMLFAKRNELANAQDVKVLLKLAFDSGSYEDGSKISVLFSRQDGLQYENLARLADLAYYSGSHRESYELHRQAAFLHPEFAELSFINIFSFQNALAPSVFAYDADIGQLATDAHPNSTNIVKGKYFSEYRTGEDFLGLNNASNRIGEGFSISFQKLLTEYLSDNDTALHTPGIEDLELLLWNEYNQHPEDADAAEALLSVLFLHDDRDGLRAAIQREERIHEHAFELYSAYLLFVSHRFEEAETLFLHEGERGNWAGWYNAALFSLEDRQPTEALQRLFRAEELLSVESGDLLDLPENVYHSYAVELWAHIALAAALNNEFSVSRHYLQNIQRSGNRHSLSPRIQAILDRDNTNSE